MLKTILVLSDGTEIVAGVSETNAIQSTSIQESTNDGEDLTFGSVCAKMISVKIITPLNQLPIMAGEKIIVYEEENGVRRKKGHFIAEKPQKQGANTTNVIAYDNISLLDKDITEWFNALDEFPYTAYNMAKITCEHCGVHLANSSIQNGEFLINETKLSSVTGRQIIRWIGEICGCFCVSDEDGNAIYRWYVKNDIPIVSNRSENAITFFQGSLSYEDYKVRKIDRVQIRQDAEDVGISYPTHTEGGNAYIIQSNPFLMASDAEEIKNISQTLYEIIQHVTYTPCKVSIPSSFAFAVGDIIEIADANGVKISAYVMQKSRNGQKETLESTGNYERNGATTLYSTRYGVNYGENLKMRQSVARIEKESSQQGARIGLLVETTDDGEYVVRGSVMVEAINGQTAAKISADVVNIDVVKTLNAKADEINITSDLLKISSSGFSLENGALYATEGEIGGWVMEKDNNFKGDPVLRTKNGIYGTISYNAGVYVEKTGYIFIVQTYAGTYYIVKESAIYESETLAKVSALRSVGLSNLTFYYEDDNSGGGIA